MTEGLPYRVANLSKTKLLPRTQSNFVFTPLKSDTLKTKLQTPEPYRIPQLCESIFEKYLESAADTYHDEDSMIMSEHGQEEQKFTINRISLSARKIPKQTPQEAKPLKALEITKVIKDKVILPNKKKMDFNISLSPLEIDDEEEITRIPTIAKRGYSTRLENQENV